MNLRRSFRKTIKRGTIVYAKVESYDNGLATVRVGKAGGRLTNLSTIGGVVSPGDTVIVDYSAGIVPIVRPLFIEDDVYDDPTLEEAELVELDEPTIVEEEPEHPIPEHYIDVGWYAQGYSYDDGSPEYPFQNVPANLWFPWVWATNEVEDQVYAQLYDTHKVLNPKINNQTAMVVPVGGKYMLSGHINWWTRYIGFINTQRNAFYAIGFRHNYSTILRYVTTRDDENKSNYWDIEQEIFTIASLSQGDVIEFVGFQTSMADLSNGYGYFFYPDGSTCSYYYYGWLLDRDNVSFGAQLIPGTQG